MIRGRTDGVTRVLCWGLLSLLGYFAGKVLAPSPQYFGGLIFPMGLFFIVLGYSLGSCDIDSVNRCRHSRLSYAERVLNTLKMRRFILTVEEVVFFSVLGYCAAIVSHLFGNTDGRFPLYSQSFLICGSGLIMGLIAGLRTQGPICISCNQHQDATASFLFKPLTNPELREVPERCRAYAEEVAFELSEWMENPDNEGGVIVLDGFVGSGKSTFKNFVLTYLSRHRTDVITVEVGAWETLGERELQRRLLSEIISSLDNHYSLGTYRSSWSGMLDSLAKGEPRLSPIFWIASNLSAEDYLSEWRQIFLSLPHKVLVVIEDLERFSAKELFALLRLIDELREFPNLTFFIPTDRSACQSLLMISEDENLPIDWRSLLERTLGGRTIPVYSPSPDERLDVLRARFAGVAERWAANNS